LIQKKKIATTRSHGTVDIDWSPDGEHFFLATTSPRLRVDNRVKVYRYDGNLLFTVEFDELTHVSWRPVPVKNFKRDHNNRSPSPEKFVFGETTPQKKTSVYRPPGSTGQLAARIRAERARENVAEAKIITASSNSATFLNNQKTPVNTIPGLPVGYQASTPKSIKKKSKKKAKNDNSGGLDNNKSPPNNTTATTTKKEDDEKRNNHKHVYS